MPRRRSLLALAVALALGGGAQADASAQIDSFRPLTSFGVAGTAAIVQASPDGNTLAYTDSSRGLIGFVDITDPLHPAVTAEVPVGGEPTSVDITPDGRFALATVWTSKPVIGEPPPAGISANTGGALVVIRMADKRIVRTIEIGFHPDSVKATIVAGRTVVVVAIENEPIYVKDGVVVDEDADEPKTDVSPPGLIQIVTANRVFDVWIPADLIAAAGALNVDDPQPEFVAIHGGEAAVSLQENNAIAYSPDGTVLFSADEGELNYTGGRGWSAWSAADGAFLWDDGGSLEAEAVRFSHYPEGRSANKGIEVEGVTAARFGTRDFAFLLSERGSFMAVYDVAAPQTPELVQILPTGVAPEGVVAIPGRGLVVTADEVSETLTLFQDETYGVIERDKELGIRSQVKRLYRFSLEDLRDGDVIAKTLAVDLLDTFFPYEKVEGATVSRKDASAWVALDNDGGEVESRLVNVGPLDSEDGDEDEHAERHRDGKDH